MIKSVIICVILISSAFARLDFLVMGDWGGQGSWPYTTHQEVNTAKGMGEQAKSLNATFSLALGDNFYSKGIPTDEHDKRFNHTFENVFNASSLKSPGFTFHVIAGNHDHIGNVTAETAYSSISERWSFPSLWYTFTETDNETNATIQFVMIDTVVLAGQSDVINGQGEIERQRDGWELIGPDEKFEEIAESQMQWLEETLKGSEADYLIVAGHYPVWSICEHGPTSFLVQNVIPLLEKYKVTAFFNGHDHCAEFIYQGTGIQYHTIGSAHTNDKSTAHSSNIPKNSLKWHNGSGDGGFASVQLTGRGLVVTHRDGDGKVLYVAPTMVPRNLKPKLIIQ